MKFIYTIAALLTALSIIVLQLFRGIYIINFIQNGIWIFISLVISFRAIKYNKQFLTWLFIFSVFFLVSMLSIILNSDTFMQPYSYYKLAKFFLLWAFMFFVGYFLGEELLQALYKVSILWILTTFIYAAMVSFNTLQLHSMLHHLKSTYLPLGRSLSVAALSTLFLGLG
ncbi:MAG: hypothetical protein GXO35_01715, partial [Gammaproteobacteria bacterium]|nr:hypothetical protein [Gammaproteobacteria bacterium]